MGGEGGHHQISFPTLTSNITSALEQTNRFSDDFRGNRS